MTKPSPSAGHALRAALLGGAVGARAAVGVLRTLKREVVRGQPKRPRPIALDLFEWPARHDGPAEFERDYPGHVLPYGLASARGSSWECGQGRRPDIGWAYSYQVRIPAEADVGTHFLDTSSVFQAPDAVLLTSWPCVVADCAPMELARRMTWGVWAVEPGEPIWEPSHATPSETGETLPALYRTRDLDRVRGEPVPQMVTIADYVLASLVVMDLLIATGEDLLDEASRAPDPVPDERKPTEPTRDEWRAWILWNTLGKTQTDVASIMSDKTGEVWKQPKVARAAARCSAWMGAGNKMPTEFVPGIRQSTPGRAISMDPAKLDQGSRRTIQRPREDESE